jgi:hypothetical protein
MAALAEFETMVTFCFTPEHRGLEPHHSSPPQVADEYPDFCAAMVRRYARSRAATDRQVATSMSTPARTSSARPKVAIAAIGAVLAKGRSSSGGNGGLFPLRRHLLRTRTLMSCRLLPRQRSCNGEGR